MTVRAISERELLVNWDIVHNGGKALNESILSYYYENNSENKVEIDVLYLTSYKINYENTKINYNFSLTVRNGEKTGYASYLYINQPVPKVVTISINGLVISWNGENSEKYEIHYKPDSIEDFTWEELATVVNGPINEYEAKDLENCRSYNIRIRGITGSFMGQWKEAVNLLVVDENNSEINLISTLKESIILEWQSISCNNVNCEDYYTIITFYSDGTIADSSACHCIEKTCRYQHNYTKFDILKFAVTVDNVTESTGNIILPKNPNFTFSVYSPYQNVFYDSGAITDINGFNFKIFPDLPDGLSLNKLTGRIYGTPTNPQEETSYTLNYTSQYFDEEVEIKFNMTVYPMEIELNYPKHIMKRYIGQELKIENSFLIDSPEYYKDVDYKITPSLLQGLYFNKSTGEITGVVTNASIDKETQYYSIELNGKNATIRIQILDIPKEIIVPIYPLKNLLENKVYDNFIQFNGYKHDRKTKINEIANFSLRVSDPFYFTPTASKTIQILYNSTNNLYYLNNTGLAGGYSNGVLTDFLENEIVVSKYEFPLWSSLSKVGMENSGCENMTADGLCCNYPEIIDSCGICNGNDMSCALQIEMTISSKIGVKSVLINARIQQKQQIYISTQFLKN